MTLAHQGEAAVSLSDRFLIDSSQFDSLSPDQRSTVLAANSNNLRVIFVNDFNALQSRQNIIDGIMKGRDVSLELEFNGIVLTDEERAAIAAVAPIITKIKPANEYPWLEGQRRTRSLHFDGQEIQRDGYAMPARTAKRIWNIASHYWSGGPRPDRGQTRVYGDHHYISYNNLCVAIGCQRIPRADWEAAARHYGWAPNCYVPD